jgi:hypothetical protein
VEEEQECCLFFGLEEKKDVEQFVAGLGLEEVAMNCPT